MKKSPYQKIRDAGEKGTGLRLSAEEVSQMCSDTAIIHLAEYDDELALAKKKEGREPLLWK